MSYRIVSTAPEKEVPEKLSVLLHTRLSATVRKVEEDTVKEEALQGGALLQLGAVHPKNDPPTWKTSNRKQVIK